MRRGALLGRPPSFSRKRWAPGRGLIADMLGAPRPTGVRLPLVGQAYVDVWQARSTAV